MLMPLWAPSGAMAQSALRRLPVLQNLRNPLWVENPPGDASRLFIIEQQVDGQGLVRVFKNGAMLDAPFASVPVSTGGEQGLLGLAFHPGFASNGVIFLNYTDPSGTTIVARVRASASDPDVADVATMEPVITINQEYLNHNGGWIGFGPDGYLYIAMGDGGGADDPFGHGQNPETLLSKMLRIDVDGADNLPGNDDDDGVIGTNSAPPYTSPANNPFASGRPGRDEIWALGLRNPWRNSFDRLTGDLWIGDVGQVSREEVNFQPAGNPFAAVGSPDYQGGRNYGWRCREGLIQNPWFAVEPCLALGAVDPLFDISHTAAIAPTFRVGCSVAGGYVYRGSQMPWLQGSYIFSDYCTGVIMAYDPLSGLVSTLLLTGGSLLSFGQGLDGELFYMKDNGPGSVDELQRIVPCPADFDRSGGTPDVADIDAFFRSWLLGEDVADVEGSGGTPDVSDIDAFFGFWLAGGCA